MRSLSSSGPTCTHDRQRPGMIDAESGEARHCVTPVGTEALADWLGV
jgi:hypothetical protein